MTRHPWLTKPSTVLAGGLALGLVVWIAPVLAQWPPDTAAKLECQVGASRSLGNEAIRLYRCSRQCVRRMRLGGGAVSDCFSDEVEPCRRLEISRAATGIAHGCARDCVACYQRVPGVGCPSGTGTVPPLAELLERYSQWVVNHLSVYCTPSPTRGEASCEDEVARNLAKFAASKLKCFAQCVTNEFTGVIRPGGCERRSDSTTRSCVDGARTKALSRIHKTCRRALPTCYGDQDSFQDGAQLLESLGYLLDFGRVNPMTGGPPGVIEATFCGY